MENKLYYYFVLANCGDYDNYNVNYSDAHNFLCLTTKKINQKYNVPEKEIYGREIINQDCDSYYTTYEVKNLTKHEFEVMSRIFTVVVNEP